MGRFERFQPVLDWLFIGIFALGTSIGPATKSIAYGAGVFIGMALLLRFVVVPAARELSKRAVKFVQPRKPELLSPVKWGIAGNMAAIFLVWNNISYLRMEYFTLKTTPTIAFDLVYVGIFTIIFAALIACGTAISRLPSWYRQRTNSAS